MGDPAAAGTATIDEGIRVAQPGLDLLQNRVEQGLASTRGSRKEQVLQGPRKPGRWSVGEPVHAQPGSIAGLQFDP